MSTYPYLTDMMKELEDHPLKDWMYSSSKTYNTACAIIDESIKLFKRTKGFDELYKNLKTNKNRFWDYITELYIARAIYPLLEDQGLRLSFNFTIDSGGEIDLLIENDKRIGIEISSMLNCKNLNLLIEKLFLISKNAHCNIEIKYENDDIPELANYENIKNICSDFERNINADNSFSYLSGKVVILKTESTESVASNNNPNPLTEEKVIDDITQKIHKEAEQLSTFMGKRILIVQMQHYNPIAQYYFEAFSEHIGGYDVYAKKLIENIPHTIDIVIFWWTSIDRSEPHSLFFVDKINSKIMQARTISKIRELL